jgi:hypothetical protein
MPLLEVLADLPVVIRVLRGLPAATACDQSIAMAIEDHESDGHDHRHEEDEPVEIACHGEAPKHHQPEHFDGDADVLHARSISERAGDPKL